MKHKGGRGQTDFSPHSAYRLEIISVISPARPRETKEGPGKSMKNVLYVLRCAKRHNQGQSDVNSKKIKAYQAHSFFFSFYFSRY